MGCIFSQPRGSDSHNPRLFKVLNMDKDGLERNSGKIEITDTELVFHQKNKEPIRWPLKSLRRYGYDNDLFSFESGRRCPTGQGIYAFKCSRAEALFNLLQESIQRAGQTGGDDQTSPRVPVIDATQRPMSVADLQQHPVTTSASTAPTTGDPPVMQRSQASHPPVMMPHTAHATTGSSANTMNGVVTLQAFPQISSSRHEYINADTFQNGGMTPHAVTSADHPLSSASVKLDLSRQVSLVDPEPTIQYAELDLGGGGGAGSGGATGGTATNQFQSLNASGDPRGIDSCHANYMNVTSNGSGGASAISNGATTPTSAQARTSPLVSQSVLSSSVPLTDAPALPPLPEEEDDMTSQEHTVNYLNLGMPQQPPPPPPSLSSQGAPGGTKPKVTYIEVDFKNNETDSATGSTGAQPASHSTGVPHHLTNGNAISGGVLAPSAKNSAGGGVGHYGDAPLATPATTESYAVIDFHKTAAINAKNTTHLDDEGARKTRHNSNIDFT